MLTRTLAALAAATILLIGGATVATANDTPPAEPCVPSDAWTETIEHPAVGEETLEVVDVEAWTETITHPAVYRDVEHAAEYAIEHEFVKHVKGLVQERKRGDWQTVGEFGWEPWVGNLTRWEAADFAEEGPHHAVQWQHGNDRKVTTAYRYVATGQTRQGELIREAWVESVLVTEAWVETIEHEATFKTVPNPDYVAAWTEVIEHPAVVCEDPEEPIEPEEPTTPPDEDGEPTEPTTPDDEDPVTPDRQRATDVERGESLAETGPADLPLALGTMVALIGAGLGLRRWAATS